MEGKKGSKEERWDEVQTDEKNGGQEEKEQEG